MNDGKMKVRDTARDPQRQEARREGSVRDGDRCDMMRRTLKRMDGFERIQKALRHRETKPNVLAKRKTKNPSRATAIPTQTWMMSSVRTTLIGETNSGMAEFDWSEISWAYDQAYDVDATGTP